MPQRVLGHVLEYAKSSQARCKGTECGQLIMKDTLRYGIDIPHFRNPRNTMTVWRHWECVTEDTLRTLRKIGTLRVKGWEGLQTSDKLIVQSAIQNGFITPTPAPVVQPSSSQAAAPSQANTTWPPKRKRPEYEDDNPSSSQTYAAASSQSSIPSSSQASRAGHSRHSEALSQPFTQNGAVEVIDVDLDDVDTAPETPDEVYVSMPTKVVGVRFYHGMVGVGELVSVHREPTNRYDSNAIRVLNASGTQVGHLPKAVAGKLAPLLDGEVVSVEGVMNQGNMSGRLIYDLAITLNICGPSDPTKRAQIEPRLIWATPGQRGFDRPQAAPNQTGVVGTSRSPKKGAPSASQRAPQPSSSQNSTPEARKARLDAIQKALELSNMMTGLAKVDDAGRRSTLLDTICSGDILELPMHPDPPSKLKGNLNNDLLKHQCQGLLWCIEREYPRLPMSEQDPPCQFWKYAKHDNQSYYLNTATHTPQTTPPTLGRGAIMADSMGLGKTLTMLSLILTTMDDVSEEFSNATLIVVPLSVISNWQSQIQEHVGKGQLSVHVYHGASGRNITAEQLSKFGVVLTTFQTVAQQFQPLQSVSEAPKKKAKTDGGLFTVKWKRVILDEGHTIRNAKAKLSQAVCGLEAQRRWVVTGTPIVNSPNDLGSLLKFLRICTPLDQSDYFNRTLARPLTQASPEAVELFKTLMSTHCLRRTKEMHDKNGRSLVPLPPVEVTIVRVTLSDQERELYDNIFQESQRQFSAIARSGLPLGGPGVQLPMAANVLSMLTRLRQLTLHPSLIPNNYLEDLREAANFAEMGAQHNHAPAQNISPEERLQLQQRLFQAMQDNEECSICFDTLNDPRILPCTHYFCLGCITEIINRQHLCPMDRRPISLNDMLEAALPPATQEAAPGPDNDDDDYSEGDTSKENQSSSKIDHLISLLNLIPATEKSLVFSQFTGFLDLIAVQLDLKGIPYVRFDGSMSARRRQQVLEEFSVPVKEGEEEESDEEAPVTTSWLRKGKFRAKPSRNPVVMLISLKAGALGLNLTVASRVFLMDPWWQSAIELQAIDRVNRIGQTKNVHVYQMVADDTVEARVLSIQDRKRLLIEQAFSGTRRNETHRQKKEARLQDLMAVFGEANPAAGRV